jgi:hypothetical protein
VCTVIGAINKCLYSFKVSYIVESSKNILKIFVHFCVPCTNCTVSNTCIFLLKVSKSGESSLLLLRALTL